MGKYHISKLDLKKPSLVYCFQDGDRSIRLNGQTNYEFLEMCFFLGLDTSKLLITPKRLNVASFSP